MNTKRIVVISLLVLLLIGSIYYLIPRAESENKVEVDRKVRIEELLKDFVKVDGGTFVMWPNVLKADFETQILVTVESFFIQSTEVNQELYELVMGDNPSENKSSNKMPVTDISWEDCQKFIEKLNLLTGREYRLPTEQEWEFAARGGKGSQGFLFSGSNKLDEVGWFAGNSEGVIHESKQKTPNELGLYDMSGNVLEWCSDTFRPKITDSKDKIYLNGKVRVARGGYWDLIALMCENTFRVGIDLDSKGNSLGFRLAYTDHRM